MHLQLGVLALALKKPSSCVLVLSKTSRPQYDYSRREIRPQLRVWASASLALLSSFQLQSVAEQKSILGSTAQISSRVGNQITCNLNV